ncbi:hypothetical protein F4779DRAFT_620620 [Xylariaceae sp. FL0662B]|nr:hypothetical protein F4779DRAFT_620620 [Xylariaceae sp. FL0662B]
MPYCCRAGIPGPQPAFRSLLCIVPASVCVMRTLQQRAEVQLGALQAAEQASAHWMGPGVRGLGSGRIRNGRYRHIDGLRKGEREHAGGKTVELRVDAASTASCHLTVMTRTHNASVLEPKVPV